MVDLFSLEKKYADQMINHDRREAPNECCGILAGTNETIIKLYSTTNIDHSPSHYRIDPQEMFAIYKEIRENKWEILGIYHSHPQTSAYPSATDIKSAVLSGPIYFILSLKNPDHPVIRGFRVLEAKVNETELKFVES